MRRWQTVLVLLACAAWAHDDHEEKDESFKGVVQLIVRASRENLRPLKTSRIEMHPSMHYWYEVSDLIPGATMCRIYEHPRMVYRCEWATKSPRPVYDKLVKDLVMSLGSEDWVLKKAATSTRFDPVRPNRNGVIDVRLGGPGVETMFYPVQRDY